MLCPKARPLEPDLIAGVAKMSVGEKSKLTISSDFAYGSRDVGGGLIPANSTLIFEVCV